MQCCISRFVCIAIWLVMANCDTEIINFENSTHFGNCSQNYSTDSTQLCSVEANALKCSTHFVAKTIQETLINRTSIRQYFVEVCVIIRPEDVSHEQFLRFNCSLGNGASKATCGTDNFNLTLNCSFSILRCSINRTCSLFKDLYSAFQDGCECRSVFDDSSDGIYFLNRENFVNTSNTSTRGRWSRNPVHLQNTCEQGTSKTPYWLIGAAVGVVIILLMIKQLSYKYFRSIFCSKNLYLANTVQRWAVIASNDSDSNNGCHAEEEIDIFPSHLTSEEEAVEHQSQEENEQSSSDEGIFIPDSTSSSLYMSKNSSYSGR